MRYVKQEITDYESDNIEPLYLDWVATETYVKNAYVKDGSYFFKSVIDNNLNLKPSDHVPTYWIKWGVSNKFSMIDLQSSTKTVVENDNLIAVFQLANIDTLAIGYYKATTLKIENIDDSGTALYTQTFTQSTNSNVTDYYTYLYAPYTIKSNKGQFVDVPKIGTKLRVSFLRGTLNEVSCGFLIGGESIHMGETLEGVNFSFNSYSTKAPDEYGIISILKRSVQDLVDFETSIEKAELTQLKRYAKRDYEEIVAFIVDDSDDDIYENLITLGVIQSVSTVATNHTKQIMTFSILEAI